ncbi:exo-alpha-sialidase [Rugosimonospora acidiphila]|uniref:Exo-alpha-sialidase n=1 Tax=Rugosimonospora acidiphila TaxID=556531 RepID=A0ABP9RSA1_9ACTN
MTQRSVLTKLLGGVLLAAGTGLAMTVSVVAPSGQHHDPIPVANGGDYHAEAPIDYLAMEAETGQPVSAGQVALARQQAAQIPTGSGGAWQYIGPTNIGGRVDDLTIDPTTSPSTVYAAVTTGGVMKSTDGGINWSPAWSNADQQAIGALARSSNGTLWAGTGEANPSGGGDTFFGDGIYRSTDGGASWDQWGLPDSGAFGRIVVNPKVPSQVWAAASGSISWVSGQRGLYELNDRGKDWKLSLAPTNDTTGAIDVAVNPADPNIILASMWDRSRNNGGFTYGGVGSGLYRSTNGGKTWTRLDNSAINGQVCPWDPTQTGLNTDPSLGRIGIAFAPSDPNRAYIEFAGANGPDKGLYVSNDGGATWTCGGAEAGSPNAGYEWVYGRLWVDPTNENHVFAADVNMRETINGGATWQDNTDWTRAVVQPQGTFSLDTLHADQHAMAWDPNVPGRVYVGNDGGAYVSTTNGDQPNGQPPTSNIATKRNYLHGTIEPWTQSYYMSVSQQDPSRMATALQDNGSSRSWQTGVEPTDLSIWNQYGSGDGGRVQINPDNQNVYYECLQPTPPRISCTKFVDSGTTTTKTNFSSPAWPSTTRITVQHPLVLDPADPNYVYVGGTSIARSGDGVVSGANAWTLISPTTPDSPDSLPGKVPANEINPDVYYANEYGSVSAIAPAKTTGTPTSPSSTIYAGTDTGKLWKTTNATSANPTWTQLGVGVLPQRWVTSVTVDPTNADHVYATFSSYKEGDLAANVWESTDGGTTWTDISGNLPNAPVWGVTFDQAHNQLYAATDYGVFYLKNGKKNWARLGTDLPNCPVLDVKLSADGGTVYAATYGRGIYQLQRPQG